jgi:hypothetical protein
MEIGDSLIRAKTSLMTRFNPLAAEPSWSVRRAETAAHIAMKEFVEQPVVAEMRVLLLNRPVAEDRPGPSSPRRKMRHIGAKAALMAFLLRSQCPTR